MPRLPGPEDLGQRPTPTSPGGIAQYRGEVPGLEASGTANMNLGRTLSAVGDELWHEQNRLDTIKAEEAFNDLRRRQLDLTIGEKGFANLKGGDAVQPTYFPSYMTQFGRAVGEVAGTLTNDNQKEMFKRRADVASVEFKGNLLNHAVQQSDAMAKATTQATVDTEIANIAANPLDDGKVAFSNLRISEALAAENKRLGIPNDSTVALAQAQKVQDAAWQKRIDAVLYADPIAAERLFKANEKQISNPALRLQLQHQVREAALSVSAGIEAQRVIDQTRTEVEPKTRAPRPAGEVEVGFNGAVESLLKREGGYKASDGKSGAPVNFGINQKANPDIDVAKLTKEQAKEIYRKRYWDAIGGDSLPPATAMVALDAAALQGPEVAKKLIMDADGDPQTMIDIRRQQLTALAARDPAQAKYLPQWLKRLDGLQAEVGGMQNVAYHPDDPTAQNTSGLPNSRDLAAQLPMMEGRVDKRTNELYGTDQTNPDWQAFNKRMKGELRAKVAADVQQLAAIQRQAQGTIIDAIMGAREGGATAPGAMTVGAQGSPRAMITAFSQLQSDPNLMRAWQLVDPGAKPALVNLMKKNLEGGAGDERLYRALWNRIHLEPGDPQKIDFYQQIVDPAIADRLSIPQIGQLRLEIDRAVTPGGRSLTQMRTAADAQVSNWFRTTLNSNINFAGMKLTNPGAYIDWTNRWNEAVGKKIDEHVKAGTTDKVRAMFMLDTPESVITPQYMQTFIGAPSTSAQGLAEMAGKAGAPAAQPPAQMPATITTKEAADAWFKTLPAGVDRFTGPDGQVRMIPPGARATAAAPATAGIIDGAPGATAVAGTADQAAAASQGYGARADGTPKGPGYFGELPAPGGKKSTEISIGINLDGQQIEIPALVPTLTRAEIDQLLTTQKPTKEIEDKAVAFAKTRLAAGRSPFAAAGEQVALPPAAITVDSFDVVDKQPTTVAENIASIRKARAGAMETRKFAAQGPQFEVFGPALALLKSAVATYGTIKEAIASLPRAVGEAISKVIPTELESVHNGFEAIKKSRKVTRADEDILSEVLRYGLLKPEDEKLARGLLDRLNKGK